MATSRARKTAATLLALTVWTGSQATVHAKEKVVTSLRAGKDGVPYQVVCDACKKGKSCLSVRVAAKDAPGATLVLDEDRMCRGDSNASVEYTAQEFRLSPAATAALIKEDAGGEGIAHSYWLVALIEGKLTLLWHETFSTHEVVPIDSYSLKTGDRDKNGRQEIDYRAPFPTSNDPQFVESALGDGGAGADTWQHQLLEFSDAKKAMVEKSPHEEYAAVLVSTKSVRDALSLKLSLLKDTKCGAKDFLVLHTDTLPKLRKGLYVVAAIGESRAEAQEYLNRIRACRPAIAGAIRQVR